ncbi:MAG: sugar nucleotide-binding protein [Nanoarchaeota archaeon]|nr:sugar nucleotide-binding protein [Nanoarchaeota archaeon]
MTKVVVFGASGMLGYAVSEYFGRKECDVVQISRNEFDIAKDSHDQLSNLVDGAYAVINCAGVIKPRIKDMSIEDVLTVNSIFPRNLAKACKAANVKCFHITTDCVYTGNKGKYSESDMFDAEELYGLSKSGGDNAECMVLRTSIIGEENGHCRSLLEWAKSQAGKEVNGFTNHKWNGVTTLYFAEVIENILKNNLYQKGLFHIHSPNIVDKYELLQIFDEVYELKLKINAVEAKDAIDRSIATVYDLSVKVCTKTLQQQVKEMCEFFQNVEI